MQVPLGLLTSLEGRPLTVADDSRILKEMKRLRSCGSGTARSPASGLEGLGRLTLMTGGLGPGGAERQLTRLAVELERVRRAHGSVGGVALPRPIEVLVRSHSPETAKRDRLFADLRDEGVELQQINDFQPVAPKTLGIEDPVLLQLLTHLPPVVNYPASVDLTPHFVRSPGTDTRIRCGRMAHACSPAWPP